MKNIGKRISQIRKLRKLTQKEFAARAEINYRHFQDIEASKANIRISTANEIAKVLDVPIGSLFDEHLDLNLIRGGIHSSWQALNLLPTGVCIVSLEGKLIFLNEYFKTELTDLTDDDIAAGCNVWDLLPEDQRSHGKKYFQSVLRDKPKPLRGRRTYAGPKNKNVDVVIFWNYLWDAGQRVVGVICTVLPAQSLVG